MACKLIKTRNIALGTGDFIFKCTMSPPNGFRLKRDLDDCSKIIEDTSKEFIAQQSQNMKEYTKEDAIEEFQDSKESQKYFQLIANFVQQHSYLDVLKESEKKPILNFDISAINQLPNTLSIYISIESISLKDFLSYEFFKAYEIIEKKKIADIYNPQETNNPQKIADTLSNDYYSAWIHDLHEIIFDPTFTEHCIEPLEVNPSSNDPRIDEVADLSTTFKIFAGWESK